MSSDLFTINYNDGKVIIMSKSINDIVNRLISINFINIDDITNALLFNGYKKDGCLGYYFSMYILDENTGIYINNDLSIELSDILNEYYEKNIDLLFTERNLIKSN